MSQSRQTAPCPLSPRVGHKAVWTGEEMIIWGGEEAAFATYCGDGARYDPKSDRWTAMTMDGAPSERSHYGAVWTGKEMILRGGFKGVRSIR